LSPRTVPPAKTGRGRGRERAAERDDAAIFADFEGRENDLIAILLRFQKRDGHISEAAIRATSRFLRISENRIYGVASFYGAFTFDAPGRHTLKVCTGTACHLHGGLHAREAAGWQLGIAPGQTSVDGRFTLKRANCVGCCTLGPVVQIDDDVHGRAMVTRMKEVLDHYE
jgi:NADH-quinone oxidoreductase subunit E